MYSYTFHSGSVHATVNNQVFLKHITPEIRYSIIYDNRQFRRVNKEVNQNFEIVIRIVKNFNFKLIIELWFFKVWKSFKWNLISFGKVFKLYKSRSYWRFVKLLVVDHCYQSIVFRPSGPPAIVTNEAL